MNLMFGLLLDEPDDVLGLRLGQLRRSLVRVAGAARRRARVAVEARPDPVVAVQVDAPGVAAGRIGVRVRAVVGHVPPLRGEVVEAVVRPVGVVGQDEEDVGVVDDLLRLRVGLVVVHQPLGRLQRGRRGHPLAGVVLRLDQDTGLAPVAVLADPQDGDRGRAARHLALRCADALLVEEVGQRDRARSSADDAGARVGAVRVRPVDQALRPRSRSAVATSAAVLASAPAASLASRTRRPCRHLDVEREVRARPVHELDGDVVAALVAPRRRAHDDRGLAGAADRGLRLALVAVRLVRQVDDLGDVRVLLGDLLGARVQLLRVLVLVDEVRLVARVARSAAATSSSQSDTMPVVTPPVELVTRIWLGRASSLNRFRWNMYSPGVDEPAHGAGEAERGALPESFSSCITDDRVFLRPFGGPGLDVEEALALRGEPVGADDPHRVLVGERLTDRAPKAAAMPRPLPGPLEALVRRRGPDAHAPRARPPRRRSPPPRPRCRSAPA